MFDRVLAAYLAAHRNGGLSFSAAAQVLGSNRARLLLLRLSNVLFAKCEYNHVAQQISSIYIIAEVVLQCRLVLLSYVQRCNSLVRYQC